MAKKRKNRVAPKVNLPPFPWETEATLPDGTTARLARGRVEQASIDLGYEIDGERIIGHRARVWRTKQPPMLRVLNACARAAMLDYTEAFEAVHSSGGTSDPTGGGGGGGGARSPSLRALTAAERLRHMHAALEGGEMAVPLKEARRQRRGDGMAHVSLRQLAQWVAIDGMSRADILRQAGAATSNVAAQDAATIAIAEMGQRLAICCGYAQTPN